MGAEINCSSGVGNDGWTSWGGGLVCPRLFPGCSGCSRLFRLFPLWRRVQGAVSSALAGSGNSPPDHYCIEPIDTSGGSSSASTNSHVHVDWRPFMNNNTAYGCPAGWLQ